MAAAVEAQKGDLILILAGARNKMRTALGSLRIEMGNRLGLRDPKVFAPLWVVDFPLLEWDDETFPLLRHAPSVYPLPKPEHLDWFYSDRKEDLERVCANAYDFVLNGTEVGGGSIRIHDSRIQERMFEVLGFSHEDADYRFGFLINAFKYGAPPSRRHRIRFRPLLRPLRRTGEHPRLHRIPQEQSGPRHDARRSLTH